MKPASTQMDKGLGFDGAGEVALKKESKKFAGNQHGGKAGGNYGRGPTKGNTDGKQAGPSSASGTAQYRGVGGTTVKCPANPDRQNVGRGPTKGNE